MAGKKTLEISLVGSSLAVQYFDNDHLAQPIEYYPVCSIKGIVGLPQIGYGTRDANNQPKNQYQFVDMFSVTLFLEGEKRQLSFDIQQVLNQPGWTPNAAGLDQALLDLSTWSNCSSSVILGGMAATLTSILNAIVAADQDIEILLVRDTGNADQVVQQITDYTTGVPTVSYKDVNGAVYVPVGPLVYLDPSAVLNLILVQETASAASLLSLDTKFISVTRTAALLRVTGAGAATVTAGKRSVSFFNVGSADATVTGATLARGEMVFWSAQGEDDVLGAISYNALTSTLLISTVV